MNRIGEAEHSFCIDNVAVGIALLNTSSEIEPHEAAVVTAARQASVQLTLGEVTWESSVWFCDPWPLAFHLLGQEGFFRWFDVRVRAAIYEVEIEPEA